MHAEASEFLDACKAGDEAKVSALLERQPSLAAVRADNGETPVMAALYRGHQTVVDALLAGRQ